jgi:DNA-binding MarR family transcriptional regulator
MAKPCNFQKSDIKIAILKPGDTFMKNEHQILRELDGDSTATQRDLAGRTGMSLGSVNILIKRLVKKGLIKIERINSRTIRYVLTPRGIKEKAEATYRYIVASCRYIGELEAAIDKVIKDMRIAQGSRVCLYGDRDEIHQLLRNRLVRAGALVSYAGCPEEVSPDADAVLVWQHNREEELKQDNISCLNILEII